MIKANLSRPGLRPGPNRKTENRKQNTETQKTELRTEDYTKTDVDVRERGVDGGGAIG